MMKKLLKVIRERCEKPLRKAGEGLGMQAAGLQTDCSQLLEYIEELKIEYSEFSTALKSAELLLENSKLRAQIEELGQRADEMALLGEKIMAGRGNMGDYRYMLWKKAKEFIAWRKEGK